MHNNYNSLSIGFCCTLNFNGDLFFAENCTETRQTQEDLQVWHTRQQIHSHHSLSFKFVSCFIFFEPSFICKLW